MRTDRQEFGHPLALETLESRRCLTVSAVASAGGDLLISGTPDGAVEIVAVAADTYRVTDNGVVIADETTLTGVNDDIRINLTAPSSGTAASGTAATVSLDLSAAVVDEVYASLGKNAAELPRQFGSR